MAHRRQSQARDAGHEVGEIKWHTRGVHTPVELWQRVSPEIQRQIARCAAAFEGEWPHGEKIRIYLIPNTRRVNFCTTGGCIIKSLILSDEVVEYTSIPNVRLLMEGVGFLGEDGNVRMQRFGFLYEVRRWQTEVFSVFQQMHFGEG